MNIESYALRDRFRLALTLRLRYSTTRAQMRRIMSDVRALLEPHPKRSSTDAPSVHFVDLGESWLTVEVVASFATSGGAELAAIRDEVLLGCLQIVEAAGSALAFPPMAPVMPVPPMPPPPNGGGNAYAASSSSRLAGS